MQVIEAATPIPNLNFSLQITKSTVVCSKHFTQSDYKSWTPVRRLLKPGSVPTVFDWSTKKEPRRTLKRKVLAPRDTDIERY